MVASESIRQVKQSYCCKELCLWKCKKAALKLLRMKLWWNSSRSERRNWLRTTLEHAGISTSSNVSLLVHALHMSEHSPHLQPQQSVAVYVHDVGHTLCYTALRKVAGYHRSSFARLTSDVRRRVHLDLPGSRRVKKASVNSDALTFLLHVKKNIAHASPNKQEFTLPANFRKYDVYKMYMKDFEERECTGACISEV